MHKYLLVLRIEIVGRSLESQLTVNADSIAVWVDGVQMQFRRAFVDTIEAGRFRYEGAFAGDLAFVRYVATSRSLSEHPRLTISIDGLLRDAAGALGLDTLIAYEQREVQFELTHR